jgi:hypothetical protein
LQNAPDFNHSHLSLLPSLAASTLLEADFDVFELFSDLRVRDLDLDFFERLRDLDLDRFRFSLERDRERCLVFLLALWGFSAPVFRVRDDDLRAGDLDLRPRDLDLLTCLVRTGERTCLTGEILQTQNDSNQFCNRYIQRFYLYSQIQNSKLDHT